MTDMQGKIPFKRKVERLKDKLFSESSDFSLQTIQGIT